MRVKLAVLTALATLAAAAPASAAFKYSLKDLKLISTKPLGGRLVEVTLRTPALVGDTHVRVLLPTGWETKTRKLWPVLYLLNGALDNETSWTTKGDAEKITAGYPMVVVMPDGGENGNYTDWFNYGEGGPPMWETYHIGQLVPFIEAMFRTKPRAFGPRHRRAVDGRRRSFRLRVAGIRPLRRRRCVLRRHRHQQPRGHPADGDRRPHRRLPDDGPVLGHRIADEIRWRGHNAWDLAENLRGLDLTIRTGNGLPGGPGGDTGDPVEAAVHERREPTRAAAALGIPHIWDDYGAGGHDWYYWQRDLRQLDADADEGVRPSARPRRPYQLQGDRAGVRLYGWHVAIKRPALEFSDFVPRSRRFLAGRIGLGHGDHDAAVQGPPAGGRPHDQQRRNLRQTYPRRQAGTPHPARRHRSRQSVPGLLPAGPARRADDHPDEPNRASRPTAERHDDLHRQRHLQAALPHQGQGACVRMRATILIALLVALLAAAPSGAHQATLPPEVYSARTAAVAPTAFAPRAAPSCPSSTDPGAFESAAQLLADNKVMSDFGRRPTGSRNQLRFVSWLERRMAEVPGMQLGAVPYTIKRWVERGASLRAGATAKKVQRIAISGAVPYAHPAPVGVTGKLVYVPPGTALDAKDVKGKIVIRDAVPGSIAHVLLRAVEWFEWDPDGTLIKDIGGNYERDFEGYEARIADLEAAHKAGAAGLIMVHGFPREQVKGQYAPYEGTHWEVPALYVGADEGKQLKDLAAHDGVARLALRARTKVPSPTRTVVATLPGISDERMIIESHTDGMNAVWDNGPIAMLALARYFAALPARMPAAPPCSSSSRRRTSTSGCSAVPTAAARSEQVAKQADKDYDKGGVAMAPVSGCAAARTPW